MKSLFEAPAVEEIKQRLAALTPTSERQWGKMNAPQMLAHCSSAMEMAMGELTVPRVWIGRLLGPIFKSIYSNDKPWSKSNPTAPQLVITDERDLAGERDKLVVLIDRFHKGGPDSCTKAPHCFFGKLTAGEWGKGMYKHLDHHLKQFNV